MISRDAQIEAILFWKAEAVSQKKLADIFETTPEEIAKDLDTLEAKLKDRGLTLIRIDDEVALGTSKEVSSIIEKLTKEELVRDLGKAGLETISIVLYQGPISRAEIDYIRGVNSTFILRNLLIRGLIEKIQNPKDQRSFLYKPTMDLLSHLGVEKLENLPEYQKVREDIDAFKNASANPQ
jgi:segregation and condensation protein B